MSEEHDTDSEELKSLDIPAKTVMFEVTRASYAVGIGGVVTIGLVCGLYMLGMERSRVAVLTVFLSSLFIPVVMYGYDRHHGRDLVIAEVGQMLVRPFSFLYRIFQSQ